MSYVNRNRSRARRQALAGAVAEYAGKVGGVVQATSAILDDPALPKVTGLIMDINALQPPAKPGGAKPAGIGLKYAVAPLKAYKYALQHKWVAPVAALAVLGIPFFIGYSLGKR
jgi:hypothetical protein